MPNGRQLLAEPVSQSVFSEAAAQSSQPREWALTVAASRLITTIPDWYAHAAIKGA